MGILNECLDKMIYDELTERDTMFYGVIPMLIKEAKKYTGLTKTKDEMEDIEQSLIEFCYKCIDSYKKDKGAKFSTYLNLRLRDLNCDFITKYYGIKTSRVQIRQHKEKHGTDLRIYFDTIDDFEI